MSTTWKRIGHGVMALASILVAGLGVNEFDSANDWIGLLRGLFWLIVGVMTFCVSYRDLTVRRK